MLDTLVASIPKVSTSLCASFNELITRLRSFMQHPIRLRYVRCPLDVRRLQVHGQPWHPFIITEAQTGKHDDLLLLLQTMVDVHKHTETPFLVDINENIHYRIMNRWYSSTYVASQHTSSQ